ncbi:MAG: metal-dependent transcriptional regulator [Planctomycetes bacterium]|nr:metal-dependent transcriptional regulator [Planctomycetota bacterium]
MLRTSVQDYIKTIYELEIAQKRPATKALADLLGVQMASVTGMVKHLAADGFLKHVPYRGFKLTPKGRDLALRMLRRHRLIELFLVHTLGLGWDEVHSHAEQMEHAVSDALCERMDDYLGHPQFDPHGAPIPGVDGKLAAPIGVSIAQLKAGDDGTVTEVEDKDPAFLRFLTSLGIKIGSALQVIGKEPYGGPIRLRLGKQDIVMGTEAATRVRIARSEP